MPGFLVRKPEPIFYSSPRAIVKVTLEPCLAYKHHVNVSLHRNIKTLSVKRDGEGTKNVYYFQIIFMYYFLCRLFLAVLSLPLVAEVSGAVWVLWSQSTALGHVGFCRCSMWTQWW